MDRDYLFSKYNERFSMDDKLYTEHSRFLDRLDREEFDKVIHEYNWISLLAFQLLPSFCEIEGNKDEATLVDTITELDGNTIEFYGENYRCGSANTHYISMPTNFVLSKQFREEYKIKKAAEIAEKQAKEDARKILAAEQKAAADLIARRAKYEQLKAEFEPKTKED